MTDQPEKPWYHGVKWSFDRQELHLIEGGDYVIRDGQSEVIQLDPEPDDDCDLVCTLPTHNKTWGKLIASAPETAMQRDELLAVVKAFYEMHTQPKSLVQIAAERRCSIGEATTFMASKRQAIIDAAELVLGIGKRASA